MEADDVFNELDALLRKLSNGEILTGQECVEHLPIVHWHLILDQLEKDGYTERRAPHHRQITPLGVEFINAGGYAAERRRKIEKELMAKKSLRWTKIGVWTSVAIGVISFAYTLLKDFVFR